MVNTDYDQLYNKLCQNRQMLKRQYRDGNRIALVNYMENLENALYDLGSDIIDEVDIYLECEDSYHLYCRKMREVDLDFISKMKKYHDKNQILFSSILNELKGEIPKDIIIESNEFTKKDFIDILFQFFKEIHLDKDFDKLRKNNRIYSIKKGSNSLGYFLYNPINKDSDIFLEDFHYDLFHMNTLVHEMGHYYDLNKPFKDIDDYNNYFYSSCNREVISLMMERLLQRYLLRNNIKTEEVKKKMIEFQKLSIDLLGTAYMYSLLDDPNDINKNKIELLKDVLAKNPIIDKKQFMTFFNHIYDYSFSDTYQYVYGDILSLYLTDEVQKMGMDCYSIQEYYRERHQLFAPLLLEKYQLDKDKCIKLYKKELKLIK